MSFVGILTEGRKEIELKQILKNHFQKSYQTHTIIAINKKTIDNIKNVKFEVLLLDVNTLGNIPNLQKLILNSKVLIVNTDLESNLECVKNLKLRVVSYGLNSKSTVTVSSVNEETVLISLQRSIKSLQEDIIEPQEVKINIKKTHNNLYISMILAIFSLIFNKN